MYQAVATDLDSTFMHHGMTIPALNRQTVVQATANGVHFVIASGRQQPAIDQVLGKLGVIGARVCLNGAYVVDAQGRLLSAAVLAPELITRFFAQAQAVGVNLMLYRAKSVARYDVTNSMAWRTAFMVHNRDNRLFKDRARLVQLVDQAPVYKVGFNSPDHERLALIAANLASAADFSMVWASPNFLEITAAGVTKLSGLKTLAQAWGTDVSHFAAFGDYENDLAMLAGVGYGVAMSNAIPAVKAVADVVVDNADHAGVGRTLARLLREG
ncbi:MAG: HAD family hydrolase [Lactobacillus sp.]|nr:HAD family hydrolase [Lactobacillus sp.]MCI2032806.1 HAD family hydrolase [Lactobacillus sp.]